MFEFELVEVGEPAGIVTSDSNDVVKLPLAEPSPEPLATVGTDAVAPEDTGTAPSPISLFLLLPAEVSDPSSDGFKDRCSFNRDPIAGEAGRSQESRAGDCPTPAYTFLRRLRAGEEDEGLGFDEGERSGVWALGLAGVATDR
jgi:hypothetical protein